MADLIERRVLACHWNDRAAEMRKPVGVSLEGTTPTHAVVISFGPSEKRLVLDMHGSPWIKCSSEPFAFALFETGQSDVCWNIQEDNKVETRDERLAPADDRSGEHPMMGPLHGLFETS
jgi:hypothetical protein